MVLTAQQVDCKPSKHDVNRYLTDMYKGIWRYLPPVAVMAVLAFNDALNNHPSKLCLLEAGNLYRLQISQLSRWTNRSIAQT